MPHLNEHVETWIGRTVSDGSGHKIGKIDDVYTDDDTGQPEWLAVIPGLIGYGTHFVPVRGATFSGGGVQVPFPKDRVKAAPSAGADRRLSRMEKGRLYAHYGYSFAEERNRLQRSLDADRPGLIPSADGPDVSRPVDLRDVSGPADPCQNGSAGTVRRPNQVDVAAPPPARPPGLHLADVRDVSGRAGRRNEADGEPAVVDGGDRGRWPDDDAIFGLIESSGRTGGLATSGGSRPR